MTAVHIGAAHVAVAAVVHVVVVGVVRVIHRVGICSILSLLMIVSLVSPSICRSLLGIRIRLNKIQLSKFIVCFNAQT